MRAFTVCALVTRASSKRAFTIQVLTHFGPVSAKFEGCVFTSLEFA